MTFNSYQRENSIGNRYLYNQGSGDKKFNTERIFDLGLGIDLTKYRAYDPTIGRWWQIDPKGDSLVSFTPYNYAFDNPIKYNDPKGDCPPGEPNCDGKKGRASALAAALQNNVTSKLKDAGNSASSILSAKIGVQGAGTGGKVKIGRLIHLEGGGKVGAAEMKLSNEGVKPSLTVVETDLAVKVGPAGMQMSQKDMTYDGETFKLREYDADLNEVSVGVTRGNLSAEISANLDAIEETLDSTVESVKAFFQNLLPTNPWGD